MGGKGSRVVKGRGGVKCREECLGMGWEWVEWAARAFM